MTSHKYGFCKRSTSTTCCPDCLKKNLNASRPFEDPPVRAKKMSKRERGIIDCILLRTASGWGQTDSIEKEEKIRTSVLVLVRLRLMIYKTCCRLPPTTYQVGFIILLLFLLLELSGRRCRQYIK